MMLYIFLNPNDCKFLKNTNKIQLLWQELIHSIIKPWEKNAGIITSDPPNNINNDKSTSKWQFVSEDFMLRKYDPTSDKITKFINRYNMNMVKCLSNPSSVPPILKLLNEKKYSKFINDCGGKTNNWGALQSVQSILPAVLIKAYNKSISLPLMYPPM